MKELPAILIVIDPEKENAAVREAIIKKIPIIALIDTDGDPDLIDIPIPCNDEALRVIQYILPILTSAIKEGKEIKNNVQGQKVESVGVS